MSKAVERAILTIVALLILGLLIATLVPKYPIVYWSTSQNKCINVIKEDNQNLSCKDLPKKYHKIYVK